MFGPWNEPMLPDLSPGQTRLVWTYTS